MITLLFACATLRAPALPEMEEAESRDPPVAAGQDADVLWAGVIDDEPTVQALALGAILARVEIEAAAAFALAARTSPHEVVRMAVVTGLRPRLPAVPAAEALQRVVEGDADPAVRSAAALALVDAGLAHPEVGPQERAIGVLAAAAGRGSIVALTRLAEVLQNGTLPLDPPSLLALSAVAEQIDRDLLARQQEVAVPYLECAAWLGGQPGGVGRAVRHARKLGDDAVDAWAACPEPRARQVLRALPGPVARYARVALGDLPPSAALPVDGDGWPDRVRALAASPLPGAHHALALWAERADDTGREVVALAMVGHARPGDEPLRASLRTDASFQTRLAVAAWSRAPLPGDALVETLEPGR